MDTSKKPISQFSESICKKIPEYCHRATGPNAHWILSNPVRLNGNEKLEVIRVYRDWLLEVSKCK